MNLSILGIEPNENHNRQIELPSGISQRAAYEEIKCKCSLLCGLTGDKFNKRDKKTYKCLKNNYDRKSKHTVLRVALRISSII